MSGDDDIRPLGAFQLHSPGYNRQLVGHVTRNTTIVRFRYDVMVGHGSAAQHTGRTNTILIERPDHLPESDLEDWIQERISDELLNNFEFITAYDEADPVNLFVNDNGQPVVKILEKSDVLTNADIVRHLGLSGGPPPPAGSVPMFGWADEQKPQHRAFRYMIEGCDMTTLQDVVPREWIDGHYDECQRMCAYRMLGNLNMDERRGAREPPKIFRPQEINRWLNENGHSVGSVYDGLSSDDIQAHAIHFRYGHCAMDLTRSVLNLYIPESSKERNHHYKTACYVVVGDHCQPIVDANVVKSVMKSASSRVGQRRITGYHSGMVYHQNQQQQNQLPPPIPPLDPETLGRQQTQHRRKRHRSLDRVFRPEFDRSEERTQQDLWRASNHDIPTDLSLDDWEDDFSDTGSTTTASTGGGGGGLPGAHTRKFKLPLVTDRERFHFFTKAEHLSLVEERCKPTYREGDDTTVIHYYICTDDDDVEFLYQYCIRVLKIDPMRYARSFHGRCRQIRMQNTWWSASRDIHQTMKMHEILAPTEPFQPSGMATYAFRMLHKDLCRITRRAGALWECMSHYPPNLQRLLDTAHPFQRPKLLQCTYNPPYSNPYSVTTSPNNGTKTRLSSTPSSTLILPSHRRRIDLVRSYASTIRNLKDGDQYPIHDPTNRVVPYDENLHGSLPIGHYLVDIPTEDMILASSSSATGSANGDGGNNDDSNRGGGEYGSLEDWKKLVCLPLGQSRMMTHRMLRALIHRRMLTKRCIRLVCATDPLRQNRYGPALVLALQNVLETVYRHPAMQTGEVCPKHLINHLVGLCNGTSVPHSGMRYVFHDIKHLYNLLTQLVSQDQMRRIKVLHTTGYDSVWHRTFDYYEIDSSGLSYKPFHLQPVYNMVLEDQAIRVFDIARPIPIPHLIQINIDAIEYHVSDPRNLPLWAKDLADQTVSIEEYDKLTPVDLYERYMGRFRAEKLKTEERAHTYYYKFQQVPNLKATMNRFHDNRLVPDTESTDWVEDWQKAMRVVGVTTTTNQQQQGMMEQLLVDMFTPAAVDCVDLVSKPGLLVTGPAGTGKTYFIRLLQKFATNLGLSVVKSAYTHAACVQMGCDAVTLSSLFGLDEKTDVRCTLALSRRFAAQLRALDIDVLIVDEVSMIPLALLEVLMLFHRVSSKTRICLVGDFNQLPPVEPNWDRNRDDYDYFQYTDIFPYLIYDRVRNEHGRWLQLTECMRTTDPLLVRLCQDPSAVKGIQPHDFPMPSVGIPVWRFISWRNSTRKACNFYCMHRYLQMHPDAPRIRLSLRDLYAQKKWDETQQRTKRANVGTTTTNTTNEGTTTSGGGDGDPMQPFYTQYDKLSYRPPHWKYLQSCFTYAQGMEVVCRNTLREWDGGGANANNVVVDRESPQVVNNRRARISEIDHDKKTITIQWLDVLRRWETTTVSSSPSSPECLEDHDVTLTFHDFAFNFVPGFCITAHMAQGETIREHYAVMEWPEMVANPRMAYVAVTRGSSSQYLHIVPKFADPWNTSDTMNERDNILRKLYHLFAWDKDQTYELDVEYVAHKLQDQAYLCFLCKNTKMVTTRYNYKSMDQFMIISSASVTTKGANASVTPANLALCCNTCYGNRLRSGYNNKFQQPTTAADPVVAYPSSPSAQEDLV